MLIRTLVRRIVPGVAVFAVLGAGVVAQERAETDTVSADPAVLTEHAIATDPTPQVEKRLSRVDEDADTAAGHAAEADHPEELTKGRLVAELKPTKVKKFSTLGVTWDAGLAERADQTLVEVKTKAVDGDWTDWTSIPLEAGDGSGRMGTAPMYAGASDAVAVRVLADSGVKPTGLSLATIDPGRSPDVTPVAATIGQPAIVMRSEWGAKKPDSCDSPRYGKATLGATIHHTAGKTVYEQSESVGMVRGAQKFHMGSRNWCDIGYNFLVDRFGTIYEGRSGGITKMVRGAHSGYGPTNLQTVGISMMGTFTTAQPTAAMKKSVAELVAWRFSLENIPATGTVKIGSKTFNRISGHRDHTSTACPGAAAYKWLSASGGLRDTVADLLENGGTEPPADLKVAPSGPSSLDASWSPVEGADRYMVKVSKSSSWTDSVYFRPDAAEAALTGLSAETKYYVKVAVANSDGHRISNYAKPTVTASTTSKLVAPAGLKLAVTGPTSLNASWTTVPGAARYMVKISASSSWTNPVYFRPTATNDSLTGLKAGTKYYVKVAVADASGKRITDYSKPTVTAVTAESFSPPTGLDVAAASRSSLNASWTNAVGASKYLVKVSASSAWTNPVYFRPSTNSAELTGLSPSTTYYVKVAVADANGKRITDYAKPTVTARTAANAQPAAAPTGLKVTTAGTSALDATWSKVANAERYMVKVSASSSWTNPVYFRPTTTNDSLTGLKAGTKYYVKVAVANADGKRITDYAKPTVTARTAANAQPAAAPTGLKVTTAGTSALDATWSKVANAERYMVKVSASSSWTNPVYFRPTTTNDSLTGLKAGTKYYVKVAVANADGKRITDYSKPTVTASTAKASSAKDSIAVSSSTVTFKGHGYGHGIGMSQYGAEGGARDGKKYDEILDKYYPGTSLGTKSGNIRVKITADTTPGVLIMGGSGITFRQGDDSMKLPTSIDGKTVSRWNITLLSSNHKKSVLQYRTGDTYKTYKSTTWTGEAQFEASTLDLVLPNGSTRTYRTALRSALPSTGSTTRDTLNVLSIENYTRGVVAREMPSSWHPEALKAQSVAARTYGVRSMSSSRYYDICDTTSCQVYGGKSAETSATDAAIAGTKGKILLYDGKPAFTQFSSSSGGYTNKGSQPYLKPVSDSWDGWSGNKNHAWSITVKKSTIEKKYSSIGSLKSISVTDRNGYGDMGGRVSKMKLTGSKGSKTITGVDARWAFGLRSDWFGF